MASIGIADKATLDATKALAEQIDGKCDQIIATGGSGGGGLTLNSVAVYLADFVNDEVTVISGGIDEKKHIIKS